VKEYLATLDDAAFGAASNVTPKFVSPPMRPRNGPGRCADRPFLPTPITILSM